MNYRVERNLCPDRIILPQYLYLSLNARAVDLRGCPARRFHHLLDRPAMTGSVLPDSSVLANLPLYSQLENPIRE